MGETPWQLYSDGGVARAIGARAVIYDPLNCLDLQGTRLAQLLDVLALL